MAELTCRIVRPDRLLFEGKVASVILVTHTGELGIWPDHAPEICSMGSGVMRIHALPEDGGEESRVVISGGYAEVANNTVVILADHARKIDDIEPDVVEATKQKATDSLNALPEGDHRRAYYENKIAWCGLLLANAPEASTQNN